MFIKASKVIPGFISMLSEIMSILTLNTVFSLASSVCTFFGVNSASPDMNVIFPLTFLFSVPSPVKDIL